MVIPSCFVHNNIKEIFVIAIKINVKHTVVVHKTWRYIIRVRHAKTGIEAKVQYTVSCLLLIIRDVII